jgi:hypothetical protein
VRAIPDEISVSTNCFRILEADHAPAFGLCSAVGYSQNGMGLKIQGRIALFHLLRRLRQAGRFDVSSLAKRFDLQIQGSG